MQDTMLGLLIQAAKAAELHEEAELALMDLDTSPPESPGSPLLTEKLLADAATAMTNTAAAFILEAERVQKTQARVIRENPGSFA